MMDRRLTNDGSYTLYSESYRQTYHSIYGSKTESMHVFLQGAGVLERFRRNSDTRILEVGFGTGLNFFLTADAARAYGVRLDYWAYEKQLLEAGILGSLEFETLLDDPDLVRRFLAWRTRLPESVPDGLIRCKLSDTLSLHLILGDATRSPLPEHPVHAVYLDAFSPDENPELWSFSFLKKLFESLNPNGRLATYSARSVVRKNLTNAGFTTEKRPGPPGKREMLVATKT